MSSTATSIRGLGVGSNSSLKPCRARPQTAHPSLGNLSKVPNTIGRIMHFVYLPADILRTKDIEKAKNVNKLDGPTVAIIYLTGPDLRPLRVCKAFSVEGRAAISKFLEHLGSGASGGGMIWNLQVSSKDTKKVFYNAHLSNAAVNSIKPTDFSEIRIGYTRKITLWHAHPLPTNHPFIPTLYFPCILILPTMPKIALPMVWAFDNGTCTVVGVVKNAGARHIFARTNEASRRTYCHKGKQCTECIIGGWKTSKLLALELGSRVDLIPPGTDGPEILSKAIEPQSLRAFPFWDGHCFP